MFSIEGVTQSNTYKQITWGSGAENYINQVVDAPNDGSDFIWINEQATLTFDVTNKLTASGTKSYGGTIPSALLDDTTVPDENGNAITVGGLNNYRYRCGDLIQAVSDAFLVHDKSERIVWTLSYNHLSNIHDIHKL